MIEAFWDEITTETARLRADNDAILGCRFLYSGRETFTSNNGLLLAGMNPGVELDMNDRAYSANGRNAYLYETWSGSSFQPRTVAFMERFFRAYGILDWETAFDRTLTANFLPFRTSRYGYLGNEKAQARMWALNFWERVIPLTGVRGVIACGVETSRAFFQVARRLNHNFVVAGIGHGSVTPLDEKDVARVVAHFGAHGFAPDGAVMSSP